MNPLTSDRKRTPSSTGSASSSGPLAVVEDGFQSVQGQFDVPGFGAVPVVVNDDLKSASIELPAASLMPFGPPFTVNVYVVPPSSGEMGCTRVFPDSSPGAKITTGIRLPAASRS